MIETFKNALKIKEIRNKILWTILFVVIYRIGCYIPVPGFDASGVGELESYNLLSILNAISGSALSDGTIFALGISPYINASIIMQLLTVAIPQLERLSKRGDEGKEKINKITRYVTLALATISAVGIVFTLDVDVNFLSGQIALPQWLVMVYVTIVLVAGCMLCMWLGERITEYGVSNGISMIIFVGLLTTAGQGILNTISGGRWLELVAFLVVLIAIFVFIIWVDGAERKIKIQYAKQVKGNRMYGGQATFIPIKVNASGVMPLIFAYAIMSFPTMLISTFWATAAETQGTFAYWWIQNLGAQSWAYQVILAVMIFLFAYFYSQIQFNPVEISKNIQQNGGFIPGIRPGRETAEHLTRVVTRITFWGATFLAIIALVPSLIFSLASGNDQGLVNAFSSTGMLISVSIALEIFRSLENQILMRNYKGFLK
ncbi:MAG: preprotein translocase subunit SecY [Clostridia bacterium]|nr:preprotein translocase subunit SecY [Clostridia bacterium]